MFWKFYFMLFHFGMFLKFYYMLFHFVESLLYAISFILGNMIILFLFILGCFENLIIRSQKGWEIDPPPLGAYKPLQQERMRSTHQPTIFGRTKITTLMCYYFKIAFEIQLARILVFIINFSFWSASHTLCC